MSTEDYTDRTDARTDQPTKGADLQADLARVGQLVAAAVSQGRDDHDQFDDTVSASVDDLAAWADRQDLSGAEAVATAWFFLLAAADE
jgi:hypothetical protein